jgi:hypothetical protein
MLGSQGSEEQGPFVYGQKYRNGSRGKDRTILRSHPLHRWVHNLDVCRHLILTLVIVENRMEIETYQS